MRGRGGGRGHFLTVLSGSPAKTGLVSFESEKSSPLYLETKSIWYTYNKTDLVFFLHIETTSAVKGETQDRFRDQKLRL